MLGVSIIEPYDTRVTFREYMVPGLIGIILLFNSKLSSLALVCNREMGMTRQLLTAPLPCWYLPLAVAWVFDARNPVRLADGASGQTGAGLMLGSIWLLLAVQVRQMENFGGAMNRESCSLCGSSSMAGQYCCGGSPC